MANTIDLESNHLKLFIKENKIDTEDINDNYILSERTNLTTKEIFNFYEVTQENDIKFNLTDYTKFSPYIMNIIYSLR